MDQLGIRPFGLAMEEIERGEIDRLLEEAWRHGQIVRGPNANVWLSLSTDEGRTIQTNAANRCPTGKRIFECHPPDDAIDLDLRW